MRADEEKLLAVRRRAFVVANSSALVCVLYRRPRLIIVPGADGVITCPAADSLGDERIAQSKKHHGRVYQHMTRVRTRSPPYRPQPFVRIAVAPHDQAPKHPAA